MPPSPPKRGEMEALSSMVFITERTDGRVKNSNCAIDSKQHNFDGCDKADGSSPTVSIDGLIVTTAIDVHEERYMATIDTPSAFLHAINDEHTIMLWKEKWLNY